MKKETIQLPDKKHMRELLREASKIINFLIDNPEKFKELPAETVLVPTRSDVPFNSIYRVDKKFMLVEFKKTRHSNKSSARNFMKVAKIVKNLENVKNNFA